MTYVFACVDKRCCQFELDLSPNDDFLLTQQCPECAGLSERVFTAPAVTYGEPAYRRYSLDHASGMRFDSELSKDRYHDSQGWVKGKT